MKIRRSNPGLENRWLLILPALALALGCESKTETTQEEPAEANPPAPATVAEVVAPKETAVLLPAAEAVATTEASAAATAEVATGGAPKATSGDTPKPAPATSPPAGADDTPRRGPAASGEGFNVWLEGKSRYALNQPATVTVVLTAESPFKCNDQYPYKFTLTPPSGLSVASNVVKSMNVGAQRSTMSIPFTPSAAGTHTLNGELSFSVCTEDKCLIEKQTLSIPVEVSGS